MAITNRVRRITMLCAIFLVLIGIVQLLLLREYAQFKIAGFALSLSGVAVLMMFLPDRKK